MTYREAATYTNRSTIEIKTEFEDILEALEEAGIKQEITIELLDFWLNGSVLVNYDIYLTRLDAEKLLKDKGIPTRHISQALRSDALDKYVLFKNVCLNFIGEELTADFKTLILDPINEMYVKPYEASKAHKAKQLKVARDLIVKFKPDLGKAIEQLRGLDPHTIAGTFEETILLKMEQMQHLIINQLEA
ncbi:hypothetical protein MLC52_09740 [Sulfurimonas sp. NW15]|uniref:hypothetical protein n=1 Tax=Sulfurimonas TaxID=202746 RepID=UPI00125FD5F8|nr:hypothetical protein [Sulfurimonas hydrogeniphila]